MEILPHKVCTNSASSSNASDSVTVEGNPTILSSPDEEILSILEKLRGKSLYKASNNNNNNNRIAGYFCSDNVQLILK